MVGQQQLRFLSSATLVNIAIYVTATAVVTGLWSSPSFAFGGCLQASPENPSLILGLLGAAVAALPLLRAKLKSRLRKKLQLQRQ